MTTGRIAVAFGAVGAALVVGFGVRLLAAGGVDARGQLLAVAGAVCLLVYAWLDRGGLEGAVEARAVRLGTGSALLVLLAGAVAVASYALVRGRDAVLSLGPRARVEIAPHSAGVVRSLDRDARLIGFFRHGSTEQALFVDLADRLAAESPRLAVTLVDPVREPALTRRYEVASEGVVVVESGDRVERLGRRTDEAALVAALLRVTRDEDVRVCWSVGHGEADPDADEDPESLSAAVLALEGGRYQVMETSTLSGPVPEGCRVFVVARPQVDWLEAERAALVRYVVGGGRALVLLEPGFTPGLTASLRTLGVDVGEGVVLEPSPDHRFLTAQDASFPMFRREDWRPHPLSRGLAGAVVLGIARPAAPVDDAPGMATRGLLWTTAQAWVESDPRLESPQPDAGEVRGPIALVTVAEVEDAAAVSVPPAADPVEELGARVRSAFVGVAGRPVGDAETIAALGVDPEALREALAWATGLEVALRAGDSVGGVVAEVVRLHEARARATAADAPGAGVSEGGRLLVVGDATFATNRWSEIGSNLELFLHAITWLAGDDAQLAERPRSEDDTLELSAYDQAVVLVLALFVGPGAALTAALRARWRRRSL